MEGPAARRWARPATPAKPDDKEPDDKEPDDKEPDDKEPAGQGAESAKGEGGSNLGQPAPPAASSLPDLNGKPLSVAQSDLTAAGFQYAGETIGGYMHFVNPDGSEIWIRPDGEVIRLGPKVDAGPSAPNYHPRYGPDGLPTDANSTGSG